jgi:hypothetical protein
MPAAPAPRSRFRNKCSRTTVLPATHSFVSDSGMTVGINSRLLSVGVSSELFLGIYSRGT